MAFKLILLAAVVAVAQAGVLAPSYYSAPTYTYSHAPYALSHAPIAVAQAPVVKYAAAPVVTKVVAAAPAVVAKPVQPEPFDANPQYSFTYSVADAITGDNHEQQETRNGDSVTGSYALNEPDGTRRIVEYTADAVNGFNAVVRKEGTPVAAPVKVAAPVVKVAAAPIVTKVAAPVYSYAAPQLVHHAAPAVYHAAPQLVHHAAPAVYHAAPAVVKTHYSSPYATYIH